MNPAAEEERGEHQAAIRRGRARTHFAASAALVSAILWFLPARNPKVFFWTMIMCLLNALYTDLGRESRLARAIISLAFGSLGFVLFQFFPNPLMRK